MQRATFDQDINKWPRISSKISESRFYQMDFNLHHAFYIMTRNRIKVVKLSSSGEPTSINFNFGFYISIKSRQRALGGFNILRLINMLD